MKVTSDSAHTVRSFQKIQIPPERLFAAWVEPGLMRSWLFRSKGAQIRQVEADLRVGGRFRIHAVDAGGKEHETVGEYLEIERPHRLMFWVESPALFAGRAVVSIDITAGGEGSWMSFAQTGVKKELMEQAWRLMFRGLEQELA